MAEAVTIHLLARFWEETHRCHLRAGSGPGLKGSLGEGIGPVPQIHSLLIHQARLLALYVGSCVQTFPF